MKAMDSIYEYKSSVAGLMWQLFSDSLRPQSTARMGMSEYDARLQSAGEGVIHPVVPVEEL